MTCKVGTLASTPRVRVGVRGRGRGYLGLDERVGAVFEQHLHKLPGEWLGVRC